MAEHANIYKYEYIVVSELLKGGGQSFCLYYFDPFSGNIFNFMTVIMFISFIALFLFHICSV